MGKNVIYVAYTHITLTQLLMGHSIMHCFLCGKSYTLFLAYQESIASELTYWYYVNVCLAKSFVIALYSLTSLHLLHEQYNQ